MTLEVGRQFGHFFCDQIRLLGSRGERLVAEAAGGNLGIHKTSAAEEAAIGELETAFSAANENVML